MKHLIRLSVTAASLALPMLVSAAAVCELNGRPVPCEDLKGPLMALGGFFIVMMVILVVLFALWLWMLIHAASKPIENKAMWIVLMVLVGPIVSIVYYFVVKRKMDKQATAVVPQQPMPPVAPVQ